MKKGIATKLLPLLAIITLTGCMSTGPHLKSSNKEGIAGMEMRAPYINYTNYFGYVDDSVTPDGKIKGKPAYYLYAWVPAVIDEIGVSMISPAEATPAEGDFVQSTFEASLQSAPNKFFDTYITLDRLNIVDKAKINKGGKVLQALNYNDDTSELPANPSGSSYNSLLRQVSEVSSPTKALVRGVYRISFTSFRSAIEGSFEATIGTNVPGVKIAASLEELHELVNKEG
ncbi:LipL32 family surface lipoprotein [Moritella viscosa]|uniref:LipL32 n=1 Tax=Moritella viscosa TaxID=80854 RepID=A0A090IEE9_9GAMM|nr:LipL32 family surface lipoprotein [Moritella viscosa]CED60416.1 lipoprotein, LipL32 [Moritella viscosa]SGY97768.1 LipL32 [Moritella viscosa]SGZ04760.1 LipL32 [Moritella viscosa]SGZ11299.1 LipL32 [Moritella viscosa]SGZ11457.1 LipL32 [Moritella viscosa]